MTIRWPNFSLSTRRRRSRALASASGGEVPAPARSAMSSANLTASDLAVPAAPPTPNAESGRPGVALRLERVSKHYHSTVAVRDVTLHVARGEFLTLLGPSGSGKTTTLMMIAGFVIPTAGRIYLGERDITLLPPHKRGFGMVFQSYALFPHMTVFDNIAYPLRMRGVGASEIASRVCRALAMVQLEGYEQRRPRQLSGGQQQRVALARALVFNPPVLLMDEPLGALDRKLRERMQLEIKHLQRELGITMVYVTHDQEEALVMSDRVVVMSQGRIEQVGSPDDLYEQPANRFVADFLGESNFLEGRVEQVDDLAATLVTDDGLRVRLALRPGLAAGSAASLALRPERVRIGASDGLANRYEGVVREVIYVGENTRYRVQIGAVTVLTAKRPNLADGPRPSIGEHLTIGWQPEDMVVV